jgi:phosphate/sulfate permease
MELKVNHTEVICISNHGKTPKHVNIDLDLDEEELKKLVAHQEVVSFNLLVISTSCALAMAHGSNDIANAAGPLV